MSYIEKNAATALANIFSTISEEKEIYFDGYFVADMMKLNGKDCIYPCFLGFNNSSITLVKVNLELQQESITLLSHSSIKKISIKKMFLSKNFYLLIDYIDKTSFKIAIPRSLKYIPTQQEHVQKFLNYYQR